MDYKEYLVSYILQLTGHNHSRLELYTKSCIELSWIKEELRMRDDVEVITK